MYCPGSHPVCIRITVCVLLLSNCIPLRATPVRFSRWPMLQLFGDGGAATVSNEIRRSPPSASSSHPSSSSLSSSSSSSNVNQGCPGCPSRKNVVNVHDDSSSAMSAAEKDYRVDMVKRQILNALNLADPPSVKRHYPVVAPDIIEKIFIDGETVGEDVDDSEHDHDADHSTKKLILGVAGDVQGYGDRRVKLSFVIPPEIQRAPLVRGKLWLSVLNTSSAPKRSIIITQRFRRRFNYVVGVHRPKDAGVTWVGVDLSSAWSADERTVHFDVITETAQPTINSTASPILEVNVMTRVGGEARRRVRRGVNCQSNNPRNCCLQSFSFQKEELRWEWIVHPATIEVNYCRGSCEAGTDHIYNHSSVMYTRSMSEPNPTLRAQMMPCCTPKRLGTVQLIYYSDSSALATKVIPNLRVLECGCA